MSVLTCLPSTGGPPLAFLAVGLLLTLAGAVVIITTTRRRMSALGPTLVLLLVVLTGGLGLSARAEASDCAGTSGAASGPIDQGPVPPPQGPTPTPVSSPSVAPTASPTSGPPSTPDTTTAPTPTVTPTDVPAPQLPDLRVAVVAPASIPSNELGTAAPLDLVVTVTNVGPGPTTAAIEGDLRLSLATNYNLTHTPGTDAPVLLTPNSQGGFAFTHPGLLTPGASFSFTVQVVMSPGNLGDPSDGAALVVPGTGGGETDATNDVAGFLLQP